MSGEIGSISARFATPGGGPRRGGARRQRARVVREGHGGGGGGEQHSLFAAGPSFVLVPLVAGDLLSSLLGAAGIGVSGTLIALIAVTLYGRKALQAGEAAGQTVRYLIVVAGVLVLGLLTRVIPTLRVSRAIELGAGIVDWLVSAVSGVLA